jgi:hypothetical protein
MRSSIGNKRVESCCNNEALRLELSRVRKHLHDFVIGLLADATRTPATIDRHNRLIALFFFLDKKERKNQDCRKKAKNEYARLK